MARSMLEAGTPSGSGFADGRAQLEISCRIRSGAGRHHDLPAQSGEHRPTFGVNDGLGAFDLGPFAVASHRVRTERDVLGEY